MVEQNSNGKNKLNIYHIILYLGFNYSFQLQRCNNILTEQKIYQTDVENVR